jgi:hypothetical protein
MKQIFQFPASNEFQSIFTHARLFWFQNKLDTIVALYYSFNICKKGFEIGSKLIKLYLCEKCQFCPQSFFEHIFPESILDPNLRQNWVFSISFHPIYAIRVLKVIILWDAFAQEVGTVTNEFLFFVFLPKENMFVLSDFNKFSLSHFWLE